MKILNINTNPYLKYILKEQYVRIPVENMKTTTLPWSLSSQTGPLTAHLTDLTC